jgi:hypothetical protein
MICLDAGMGEDTGVARDAPRDSPPPEDAGICPQRPGRDLGAACNMRGQCLDPLLCQNEVATSIPDTHQRFPDGGVGAVMSGRPFPISGFTGGQCYSVCNPNAATDTCGTCASCNGATGQGRLRFGVASFFAAGSGVTGVCRDDCTPSPTTNGGCRTGYTCDRFTATCIEGCLNDTQCQFGGDDLDGDGFLDIIDEGAASGATCNTATGRCVVPPTGSSPIGGPCVLDTDCGSDGLCLQFDAVPGGYCTRIGCATNTGDDMTPVWTPIPGLECTGTDVVCDVRAFGAPTTACLEGCTVGAETTDAERLGTGGGNPTCANPSNACFWNGDSEATDVPNGSCLPGNYNTETTYDVGTACADDSDCYSPYGYGRCLFTGILDTVQSGVCAIGGCSGGMGGMPVGLLAGTTSQAMIPAGAFGGAGGNAVCNTAVGDLCVGFGGGATFCVHGCASADECPTGYACPVLLTGGGRICWPNCEVNADCHSGTTCRNTMGGACAMGQECYCSDAMPAPDAGMTPGPVDAGMPDAPPAP